VLGTFCSFHIISSTFDLMSTFTSMANWLD